MTPPGALSRRGARGIGSPMKKWASLLSCGLLSACAGAPPAEPPRPAASSVVVVAPTAEPTAAPAPEKPLVRQVIGSTFEADPAEPLPAGAVARCGTTRMRAAAPSAVAVSDTGSIFAIDKVDTRWVLRDVTLGADVAELPGGHGAELAPDASYFVVESERERGTVVFFSTPKGARLGEVKIPLPKPKRGRSLWAQTEGIRGIVMAPDGTAVVVTTPDGKAHLVDVAARKIIKTVKLPPKGRVAGISRGGARAIVEQSKYEVGGIGMAFGSRPSLTGYTVLDLRTGATVRKEKFKTPPPDPHDPDALYPTEHESARFRISVDGTRLFRLEEGTLTAIDIASGKEAEITDGLAPAGAPSGIGLGFGAGLGAFPKVSRFEVLGDGRRVIAENAILELTDGTTETSLGEGFEAISASGEHLVHRKGSTFEISTGGPPLRPGHDSAVTSLAFFPDNRLVTVAKQAKFWNTDSCKLAAASSPRPPAADRVVTAPQKMLALLSGGQPMIVDGALAPKPAPVDSRLRLAALAPDGGTLFVGVGDAVEGKGSVYAVALDSPSRAPHPTRTFPMPLQSLAAAPDGSAVAVSVGKRFTSDPAELHLLSPDDLSTRAQVTVKQAGQVAFAGSDRLVHAADGQGISVRSLPKLDEVSGIHHGYCCDRVAVSPDGKLVAGADGRRLFVWETGTRKLVGSVAKAHREDIESLAFAADGRHLATGSKDTTVLLWDAGRLTVPALNQRPETRLTGEPAKRFFTGASPYYGIDTDGSLEIVNANFTLEPPRLKKVTKVVSGTGSHCAISEKKVRCWGSTGGGALGVPERFVKGKGYSDITAPTTLPVKDPVDLRMDGSYACALERDGDLICWGRISFKKPPRAPAAVLNGVKSFTLQFDRACAAGTDGVVRCWDREGGDPEPIAVKDAVAATSGYAHTCVLDKVGAVRCKGDNNLDQLGDDTGVDRTDPVVVHGVLGAVTLAGDRHATCAATAPGPVFCWGMIGGAHLARATRIPALDDATALRIDNDSVCGLVGDRALCVKMAELD